MKAITPVTPPDDNLGVVRKASAWTTFVVWTAVCVLTVGALIEAYGSGPPYYSGTTNMDKWTSPWPYVVVVAGVAIVLTILLRWIATRGDKN